MILGFPQLTYLFIIIASLLFSRVKDGEVLSSAETNEGALFIILGVYLVFILIYRAGGAFKTIGVPQITLLVRMFISLFYNKKSGTVSFFEALNGHFVTTALLYMCGFFGVIF